MDINFKKSKYKIILGSASPRRRMYFDLLKIPYKTMIPDVDEIYPTELKESDYAIFSSNRIGCSVLPMVIYLKLKKQPWN